MGFERSMDLTAEKKNDGGLTKYGFGFNKEIKGFGVEKSWGLNEVWICQWRKKRNRRKEKKLSPHIVNRLRNSQSSLDYRNRVHQG